MLLVAAMAVFSSGCFQATGPTLGILSVPIPVSPLWQKQQEDKNYFHERYARVPILGPLTSGGPAVALDPPSDDEVWWALERANSVQGGFPFLNETQRNNVTIVKEKIADESLAAGPAPVAPVDDGSAELDPEKQAGFVEAMKKADERAKVFSAATPAILLKGSYAQGGLVFGETLPGATVKLDGKDVMVSDGGLFVVGFGRDSNFLGLLHVA